jgi:hypothetical protein
MADIQRRQQLIVFRRLILAFLFPGAGHLSAGRYGMGSVFVLPAAMVLAWAFFTGKLYPATWHLGLMEGPALFLAMAAGYFLWWALSLYLTFRLEE